MVERGEISYMAGRRGRARQPAVARRLHGDHGLAEGRRDLHAASIRSTRITATSKPSSASCVPMCTCREFSFAITCSIPSASMPTTINSSSLNIAAPISRRWPSCARWPATRGRTDRQPAVPARGLLARVRAADRLDDWRKNHAERPVPPPRGDPAARSGVRYRAGNRGTQ